MRAGIVAAIVCVAIAVLGVVCYSEGYQDAATKYETQLSKINSANATALAAEQAKARAAEQDAAQKIAAIDATYNEKLNHEKIAAESVIAGLRSGAIRLRQRFACPAGAGGGVSSVATSTGGSDAAAGRGIQIADVDFFIGESIRADEVVLQLQACQAVIRADRP